MKISFLGYYGSNFGDLLMLNALVDYYSLYYDKINIYTYGNKKDLHSSFLSNSNLNKIEIFGLKGEESIAYKCFLKSVKDSRYLIWGGGTCFMDQEGTGGAKYIIGASIVGVPVLYIGIGIDSHKKFRTKLFVFIAVILSRKLYFRDEKSLSIANKLSFNLFKNRNRYIPDIANISIAPREYEVSGDFIVFCCRDLSKYLSLNNDKINYQLAQLAISISKQLGISKIINLICDREVDSKQSDRANNLFSKNNVTVISLQGSNFKDSLAAINNSKFVITSRLHPAVVSQTLNVPYALYDYSDKNKKFTLEMNEKSRLICRTNVDDYIPNFEKPTQKKLDDSKQIILDILKKYTN